MPREEDIGDEDLESDEDDVIMEDRFMGGIANERRGQQMDIVNINDREIIQVLNQGAGGRGARGV